MGSVNKAILVGNLGRDIEVTTTAGGFPIGRFSLATTHRKKDSRSGQWEDQTEWHRVVLLGDRAEKLAEFLVKGKAVYVEGRIETRSWEDKDGQKRYMTEIIADGIQLLGGGSTGNASRTVPVRGADPSPDLDEEDDDVPF